MSNLNSHYVELLAFKYILKDQAQKMKNQHLRNNTGRGENIQDILGHVVHFLLVVSETNNWLGIGAGSGEYTHIKVKNKFESVQMV